MKNFSILFLFVFLCICGCNFPTNTTNAVQPLPQDFPQYEEVFSTLDWEMNINDEPFAPKYSEVLVCLSKDSFLVKTEIETIKMNVVDVKVDTLDNSKCIYGVFRKNGSNKAYDGVLCSDNTTYTQLQMDDTIYIFYNLKKKN